MANTQTRNWDDFSGKTGKANTKQMSLKRNAATQIDVAARGRPPKSKSAPKFESRIQVKLTPEGRERLDELVDRVGASGFAEVVRDALRIYDIVTEEVFIHENQFLSRDKDTGQIERLIFWKK